MFFGYDLDLTEGRFNAELMYSIEYVNTKTIFFSWELLDGIGKCGQLLYLPVSINVGMCWNDNGWSHAFG